MDATVLVIGQNPGKEEEEAARPFVGRTGKYQNDEFLPLAGLSPDSTAMDNTIRCRYNHTNDLPRGSELDIAIKHCKQYNRPIDSFQGVIATGAVALRAFNPELKLHEWRGYIVPGTDKVFCTRHTAELFRNPGGVEITKMDWLRFGQYLRGEWPAKLPSSVVCSHVLTKPGDYWLKRALKEPYIVVDTEYDPNSDRLWLIGLLGPNIGALQLIWPTEPREYVTDRLRDIFATVPTWWHNAKADHGILYSNLAIEPETYHSTYDTMLAHAALWCELPHDLEFVASVLGRYAKLKHLSQSDPLLYNLGDIAETESIGIALRNEMARDRGVRKVVENYMTPLIPIVVSSERRGIRVDRDAAKEAEKELNTRIQLASDIAAAYAGYEINLGSSPQVSGFLTHDLHRKVKSIDEDTIAGLRASILPYDPQEDLTSENFWAERIEPGGHPILEARVLYANALQYLSHYIRPMLSSVTSRVYPRFNTWVQNTGRWSTVDPPIAQLPNSLRSLLIPDKGETWIIWDWDQIELRIMAALSNDKTLLEVFEKGWDPHTINMCDIFGYPYPTRRTKEDIANHPDNEEWRKQIKWQGGDDPRRVFAKRFVYRLMYGGKPEAAHSIPGASALQMDKKALIASSYRWVRVHPAIRRYWTKIERECLPRREARTFLGRRWRFLSRDRKRITRQMYDFGMQGAVADILNKTIIDAMKALREMGGRMVYTMHDSGCVGIWSIHAKKALKTLKPIVEQPWDIGGRSIVFPATFKMKEGTK